MDSMQEWEIQELYKVLEYSSSEQWEMTRWLLYAIVQVNSKKKIKIEDILKFPWDKGYSEQIKLTKEISSNEIERLRKKSQEILSML